MSYPNFLFGSSARTPDTPTVRLAPNHAAISLSDHFAAAQDATRIRFSRPTIDGQGFEHAAPGARVRFGTTSDLLVLHLESTGLVSRPDTFNGRGAVYADGELLGEFETPQTPQAFDWSVSFGTFEDRVIDVVWPYCAATDLRGLTVRQAATMSAAPSRAELPAALFLGDSMTHGFKGARHRTNWPALLCAERGWRELNHGYGGRQIVAADGLIPAVCDPAVIFVLAGFNNFYPQNPLPGVRAECDALLANAKATRGADVPIVVITPLWTELEPGDPPVEPGDKTIEDYRDQWRDAVTAAGGAGDDVFTVEGPTLSTTNSFSDGYHPDEVDMGEIATALDAQLTGLGITL